MSKSILRNRYLLREPTNTTKMLWHLTSQVWWHVPLIPTSGWVSVIPRPVWSLKWGLSKTTRVLRRPCHDMWACLSRQPLCRMTLGPRTLIHSCVCWMSVYDMCVHVGQRLISVSSGLVHHAPLGLPHRYRGSSPRHLARSDPLSYWLFAFSWVFLPGKVL